MQSNVSVNMVTRQVVLESKTDVICGVTWQINLITPRQNIKLRQVSYSVSSYLFFWKTSTWGAFFDNRWKLVLSSRSLWFFVELFMTIHWCQRLLTASTAGNMYMAASCLIWLPFEVLVVDNFRTDRRSNRGIVNVFPFISEITSRH